MSSEIQFVDSRSKSYASLPVASEVNKATFSFGTLQGNDTLQALRIYNGTVEQYDIDRLANDTNTLLEAYNSLLIMQVEPLCEVTAARFVRNSDNASIDFEDLAANSIPTAQKINPIGSDAGYPLKRAGIGLQWNREYFRQKEVRQYAMQIQALLTADARKIALEIRRAFFKATNYTFNDYLDDMYALPVKALLNADGKPLPPNPYGTVFNASAHSHYMYSGSGNGDTITTYSGAVWTTSSSAATKQQDVDAILTNLREHYTEGTVMLLINPTDQGLWLGGNYPSNFQKLEYVYIDPSISRDRVDGKYGYLDNSDTFNRKIGYVEGAEVWSKPWVPQGYIVAYVEGQDKPIALRVPKDSRVGQTETGSYSLGNGDLRLVYQYESYPLYAQAMVRDFGCATWNRVNGVAFYTQSTGAYATPSGL
jgi:hypothetical protein